MSNDLDPPKVTIPFIGLEDISTADFVEALSDEQRAKFFPAVKKDFEPLSAEETGWRKILIAYIRHVVEEEGISFLEDPWRYGPSSLLAAVLTPEELAALLEAEKETRTEP
jgi:hypothetical protein